MSRRFAVNVDVDSLHLYHAIHDLEAPTTDAAWEVGVVRFLELFERHGLKATFFVVARDLERPVPRAVCARLVAAGHELASHSWSHPYDLIRLGRDGICAEIARAEGPLEALRGSPVRGFRAPGYNVSPEVLRILRERDYAYDSSLFPCPPYYAARAAVIGKMRLLGQESRSIVGDPKAPFTSRRPYRYRSGLLEYPMTVLPVVRLPVIGTSLALVSRPIARWIGRATRALSFVNLEFHAVDLLDATDPVAPALTVVQPDLRVPLAHKRANYEDVFRACSRARNQTLEQFARER